MVFSHVVFVGAASATVFFFSLRFFGFCVMLRESNPTEF